MAAAEDIDNLKRSITEQDQREIIKWGAMQRESEAQIRMFKEGRTETSEGRGGAHNVHSAHEERVAEIKRRMAERRDCTIAELARETGIPATSVGRVVSKDSKMVKKMCVWVPHLLTEAQVQNRVDACRNNLLRHRRHPRPTKRKLAIDETWVGFTLSPKVTSVGFGWTPMRNRPKWFIKSHVVPSGCSSWQWISEAWRSGDFVLKK
uniref:HTH_Tnp_IS630 domain-containing protein n=1 Tax=Haemonchus contortus TaxID=6289 RepID=A0A7I4Y7H0_HAECO